MRLISSAGRSAPGRESRTPRKPRAARGPAEAKAPARAQLADFPMARQAMDGAQEAPLCGARRDAGNRAAGAARLGKRMDALAAA